MRRQDPAGQAGSEQHPIVIDLGEITFGGNSMRAVWLTELSVIHHPFIARGRQALWPLATAQGGLEAPYRDRSMIGKVSRFLAATHGDLAR